MKEHPILFSAPMVQAILEGRKKQTRRVVNPQPDAFIRRGLGALGPGVPKKITTKKPTANGSIWQDEDGTCYEDIKCPYGNEGDILWVKETFYAYGRWEYLTTQKKGADHDGWHFIDNTLEFGPYLYMDAPPLVYNYGHGGNGWYKRPSLFMPRIASRITLEVESSRVERLHRTSEKDAEEEGASDALNRDDLLLFSELDPIIPRPFWPYQFGFMKIWLTINGLKSWNENPYVWAITFKNISHANP